MLENLTGERERVLEGVAVDWYVFAGERARMLGAALSLSLRLKESVLRPVCLSRPREKDSSLSSTDSLNWLARNLSKWMEILTQLSVGPFGSRSS